MTDNEKWMDLAIKQAIKAEKKGEIHIRELLDLLINFNHNL